MKDTGKTLKNDSCLLYKMDDSVNVGILHKVILYNEDCFILVNRLSVSGEKLCNEQISYLNIDNHIFKCLLRYGIYILSRCELVIAYFTFVGIALCV